MQVSYKIKPIGIIHSSLKTREEVIDSIIDENMGEIEIFREYEDGLSDLEGFSHIYVIFWMHLSSFHDLKVFPIYYPKKKRGVFATKHPDRPNPIGISIVKLLKVERNILTVKGIDMIDKSPVIDIKPCIKDHLKVPTKRGWFEEIEEKNMRMK